MARIIKKEIKKTKKELEVEAISKYNQEKLALKNTHFKGIGKTSKYKKFIENVNESEYYYILDFLVAIGLNRKSCESLFALVKKNSGSTKHMYQCLDPKNLKLFVKVIYNLYFYGCSYQQISNILFGVIKKNSIINYVDIRSIIEDEDYDLKQKPYIVSLSKDYDKLLLIHYNEYNKLSKISYLEDLKTERTRYIQARQVKEYTILEVEKIKRSKIYKHIIHL